LPRKRKHVAAALCIFMLASSCSDQLSEGFVSDNSTCTPDLVNLATVDLSSLTTSVLTGTDGLALVAAQQLDVEAADSLRWGVQLHLFSVESASGGLYIDLVEVVTDDRADTVTLPDGSVGTQVLLSTVDAAKIPTDPNGGWVDFPFSEIVTIKSGATYWIRLVPYYPATASSPVFLTRVAGEGFAEVMDDAWSISSSAKMAYRLITCTEL